MSPELETFILYYLSWHEGEMSLAELRENLLAELGTEGLAAGLSEFKEMRLEREKQGYRRTYFVVQGGTHA